MKHLIPIIILALCGCRGSVHPVGKIGDYTVYSVKLPSAAGPSINIAVMQRGSNEPVIVGVSAGNGVSTTVLQAGGIIGAAAVLKPVETHNSSVVSGTSSPEPSPPNNINVYGPPLPPHHKPGGGWGNDK